jgi:putative spermidine/putrescine transport system ATP-binding protein/spermidine/putrescine transport system ATP-binding protein
MGRAPPLSPMTSTSGNDPVPDPILRLHSIVKRFGKVTAVDRIDLAIERGEFFTLLGPSGSGKTTMLRIIAGLEWPDEGGVEIGGRDVTRLPPYARHIGMVFQNFLLFPHKTAAENIVFPLRMQRLARAERDERLAWAMKLMRLEGLENRYPNELSGGQQQRVALARGLISRPALLLLDEPLANLDRELRSEMEVEIRRYQKQLEIPFVYVTHNQEEALTMSDRIAVMRNGIFEQVGAKTEIYTNPATAFVASFVGHANRFEGRLLELAGDVARIDWKGTSMLVPRPRDADPGATIQYAIKYEDLEVARGANGFDPTRRNWLSGRLRDVIFKGQTANYIVVLSDGSDIVVSGAPHGMDLKPSEPVVVHWPITRGACFRV